MKLIQALKTVDYFAYPVGFHYGSKKDSDDDGNLYFTTRLGNLFSLIIKLFFFYLVIQYAVWMFTYDMNSVNTYTRMVDFKKLAKEQNVKVNEAVSTIELEGGFLPTFIFMNDGQAVYLNSL